MIREQTRTRDHHGIVSTALVPGGFYRCNSVGEFRCAVTGFSVPGCTAEIDPASRAIVKLHLPAPVQLPTHKIAYDAKDRGEKVEVPFLHVDEIGAHEALQMAADTGLIVHVLDEEVAELWPEAYAQKRAKITYNPFADARKSQNALLDLIERAKVDLQAAKERDKAAHAEASQAVAK